MMYCFSTRTGQVCIDHDKCDHCRTIACVAACQRHGVGILGAEHGKPVLNVSLEEAKRRDTECLACELECALHGQKAIVVSLPIPGLEEYRERHGYTAG
jgi:hypothetical protein